METNTQPKKRSRLAEYWMNEPKFRWATVIIPGAGLIITLGSLTGGDLFTTLPEHEPALDSVSQTYFQGKVGEEAQHQISVFLTQEGDSLNGIYWYNKWAPKAERFVVRGVRHGNTVVLYAKLPDWKTWERFKGQVHPDGTIVGVWTAHDGCRLLPFRIVPSKADMLIGTFQG